MRNRILVTAVVLLAVGGGCAESIATSPECERWVAEYHQKLLQSPPVRNLATHQQRLKRYVHRTIGVITHKPKLARTASPRDPLRPAMTPRQMVKRFQILCGDLPPAETAELLPPVAPPLPATPLRAVSPPDVPGGPISSSVPPGLPGSPVIPGGPGPSSPPGSPPSSPPGSPPSVPPIQPPAGPPAPPVPEPSSIALILTGTLIAIAYAAIKRT